MVLAVVFNEHDPVQVRLHRALVRSADDINDSVEKLFPKPPKIEMFNVSYSDLKKEDSDLFERLRQLTRDFGVGTIFGLSANSEEIRALTSIGKFRQDNIVISSVTRWYNIKVGLTIKVMHQNGPKSCQIFRLLLLENKNFKISQSSHTGSYFTTDKITNVFGKFLRVYFVLGNILIFSR